VNTKILALIEKNLKEAFHLPKYDGVVTIDKDTVVNDLPWTPAQYRKFKDTMEAELSLISDYVGTIESIVNDLDQRYLTRFFGEIWRPNTDLYQYTGWNLVEEISKMDPQNVLDVGCGYHPFKGKINNLIGIDPFNSAAEYQVDILDYKVKPGSHDHIMALGSINFNSREDIESRFLHCVNLLQVGGHLWMRANPGVTHKTGPYVDIFNWTFEIVVELGNKYGLKLLNFKKDSNNRLFFVYKKL
jgi:hypothetical protein